MNNKDIKGIVVDAGHGGADSGAVGNGIVEKNLTLDISKYMANRFEELGVPVALTREDDVELTSATRPKRVLEKFGNSNDVIVISNHINAGGAEGAEVIYALRNNDELANKILSNLSQEGQIIRKAYQRRAPSNPAKDYYYMLRETPNTEAIIVEYGFLDNTKDAAKLKANYKDYAEAVVRAVAEYANIDYVPVKGSNIYTVKKGDTLWTIAKNNGLSVDELKQINNLENNSLSIGQTLKLESGPTSVPGTDTSTTYTVKSGDTLYSIARKFNIPLSELMALNNLSSNTLSIGQKLIIAPTSIPDTTQNTYVVKSGDTLYKIANNFNVSVNDIKTANNLPSNLLTIGQILIIPPAEEKPEYDTYTVKRGDTLYAIANKYKIGLQELKNLNNLTTNILSIGQKLLVPLLKELL